MFKSPNLSMGCVILRVSSRNHTGHLCTSNRHLSEFLDVLEPPLQIPHPNHFKIIKLDIPIVSYK